MESESTQEEDLTRSIIQQDVTKSKDSCDSTDENLFKSNFVSAEKDNTSDMLFNTKEFVPQVGKINGKVSEKGEEEEEEEEEDDSMNAQQLSQSSSSEDSSGSSDVSSSSSDNEANSCVENRWSSSVTCKGIKLSVKGIKSSNQADNAPCESNDRSRSHRASFCEDVKSSRLSDDSSSSDLGEVSLKPINSNCNDSNSLEKDSLVVDQNTNTRHPNSTNFKGSISNFPSHNLSCFDNSNSDESSFKISRNDRRSTGSVGSHLSLKSSDIFERKLSLSSDSSDSEKSCERLEYESVRSSLNPSVESNLFNSVKSNSSNWNNCSFKPDLNYEGFNQLSDSTCAKFNNVNTTRSPDKKIASPIKENSQGSSFLDRFSNTEKETTPESISNSINLKQNPNLSQNLSFTMSNNADQIQNNSSANSLSNSISRVRDAGIKDRPEVSVHTSLNQTNCNVNNLLAVGEVRQSQSENSLSNEKMSNVSTIMLSEKTQVKNSDMRLKPDIPSDVVDPSHRVNVESEDSWTRILNEVNETSEHSSALDIDFKSQDMGMEISSDSSLSSDAARSEESRSQPNDLSDLSFESRNSDEEIVEHPFDVVKVIDDADQGKSKGTVADVKEVIRESGENEADDAITVDVMKVIGITNEKKVEDPVIDVMQVVAVRSGKETEDLALDVMEVVGDLSEEEKDDPEVDIMKVIGIVGENETENLVVDVTKAVDGSSEQESKGSVMKNRGKISGTEFNNTVADTMRVLDRSDQRESDVSMLDVMKVIGVSYEKDVKDTTTDVMKVRGISSEKVMEEPADITEDIDESNIKEFDKNMATVMNVIDGSKRTQPDETISQIMKIIGVTEENLQDPVVDIMKVIDGGNGKESDETMSQIMNVIGISSEKKIQNSVVDGKSEEDSKKSMELDVMKVTGGSDFKADVSTVDLSVNESQIKKFNSAEESVVIKQTCSRSCEERGNKNGTTSAENVKDKRSSVNQETLNITETKSHLNIAESSIIDPKEESKEAISSDNILSIISKDLKTNNGTRLSSKTKHLLLKQKKGSIKFKKKLKLLKKFRNRSKLSRLETEIPGEESGKVEEEPLAEYAQYLGLQPTLKFKCCICAQIGFQSYAELREHQKNCPSTSAGSSDEKSSATQPISCTNAEDINQTNFRITRKVYLCSACGTYYENWNLFLHMQEVHHRFICLLCLGMFTMSYKLSDHLILTHGIEVKSFQNLSDFRQVFNCALYVSCTDCGKTFGEGDNWSSHHCLFTCNVCNIKNGHLPRCPRNFFVKGDETVADVKLPTKCIIRINPSSCTTTTLLPKRDNKCYDIASNFCSVDITEVGEASLEPSNMNKAELPSCKEKSSIADEKLNLCPTATSVSVEGDSSQLEDKSPVKESSSGENETRNLNLTHNANENNPIERKSKSGREQKDEEKSLEIAHNPFRADEMKNGHEILKELLQSNDVKEGNLANRSNQGNQANQSNDEETGKTSETSDITSESESASGIEDKKSNETSSAELEQPDKLNRPSDMKLIIKKSALNNPTLKLNANKTGKDCIGPEADILEEKTKSEESKEGSSVFDPDHDVQTRPGRSKSITNPINCENKGHSTKPLSSNPNNIVRESLDFKNRLNPDSKTQDAPILGFKNESQISRKEGDKDNNLETSMESQASLSDENRMDYESDSQSDLAATSKVSNSMPPCDAEQVISQSNNSSNSDSNRLSMVVDNNDTTTNSRSSLKGNPTDEKMIIDYEGDNAVDNADTEESNYNSFSSDEASPVKPASNSDGITLAAEDVAVLTLPLTGCLDSMTLNTIVKECVRVSCTSCAYCNHALKIAVNAKELVLHLLAEHRFTPAKDEDSPDKLVNTLKNGLNCLESIFFNTDSYDSSDKSSNLPYDGTFSCFQCPFWTLQHKDLYTHKRKMHQKTILLCVMCKSNFYSYSELLCHMCPGTYQPNDILFRCCFCHMDKIPSAFRLMVHIRKIHHTCEICLDVSTDQQKLATHMWKHKLHHLCYRCGIAYRNKPDITRHLFWKHGTESVLCKKCLQKKWPHVYHFCIPPSTVVCDECSATFTRTVALRVHKRLHTNEKLHTCTQCQEKFISKKILAKHEISHLVNKEESGSVDAEMKESYNPSITKNVLGITDPPVQIQKTDEKQNIDVDDETVPVIRIKKSRTKKSKPMLDLTDLPPLNLSSESDSEPELPKPAPVLEIAEVKSEAEDKPVLETNDSKENLAAETETEEKKENIVECIDSQRLEIILADHDYCKPQSDEKEKDCSENKENKLDTSLDLNSSLNAGLDTKDASVSDSSPTKRKSKSPKKKLNKSSNSSNSSSSSDTDSSSCSCGPNCSCSSSSSDSSTSTSSDSDSSNPENRRKQEERRQKRRERAKTKSPRTDPEPVISVEKEEPYILESDLDTDVTLTDEDFYDEYPQQHANKMLAEKQQSEKDQLMLLASVAPTHTAPSSPVVSAEEAPAAQPPSSPKLKKRLKTKRKRDETLVPVSAPHSVQSPLQSKLLQLPQSTPSLITKLPNPNARNNTPMSRTPTSEHFSDRTMSTGGSGSESESKRSSKRRRVKNKFYGYSSGEENLTESSKPRFKPKKVKKVVAMRKSEPVLTRPNPFNVTLPMQAATKSFQPSYQSYQPSVSIKPVLPSVSNIVRSTLPPVRHRPQSPFSTSDSDDDKLNIDEKYEPPQATLTPTLAAALAATQPSVAKNTNLYCYCQCPYDEVSEMIACDGDNCRIEWFHFECVGIMVPPKGQWFCPDCRKKKNSPY